MSEPHHDRQRDDKLRGDKLSDDELSDDELALLVEGVFAPAPEERRLAILVDLPDKKLPDRPEWRARRELARGWARALGGRGELEVTLVLYRNARANNADLPGQAWRHDPQAPLPRDADALAGLPETRAEPFATIFARHPLILAPTELSATAPLKLLAPKHGFRAATMPGFAPAMIPALCLDYAEIDRRVRALAERLTRAAGAEIVFRIDGEELTLHIDLRHRRGHPSGGRLTRPGTAGNLPSGEAYVVPYEGERADDASRTAGVLPVQFGDAVALFRIARNRVVEVSGDQPEARRQAERLREEPARGNLAELGLGVLADFGVAPIGEILLDEKLGLHLAFGRSDHFGGQVGAASFSRPEAVEHVDHVYLPELQPRIAVPRVDLLFPGDGLASPRREPLMRDGRYV